MHNSGFKALSLPHVYSLVDTFDIDDCVAAIRKADFGGASVTIPHKESIIPHLDTLSPAARAIGAVNTVIVVANKEDGTKELHGDNTDYLGIFNPLAKALGPQYPLRAGASPNLCALVVGAGGTARAACYCVQRLGLKLHVWNRTYEKAATLALEFGGTALRDAGELDAVKELQCVISTVPAAAGWTLPPALLEQRPAVVEVVYKPRVTALVTQARGAGCEVVQGIDMLIAQGVEQFERWTRRRAPPAMEVNVRAMPE
jgi:pentafunctional AROM polypeptide